MSPGRSGRVRFERLTAGRPGALERLIRKMERRGWRFVQTHQNGWPFGRMLVEFRKEP